MEDMPAAAANDMKNIVKEDPEQGCIVQADDPHMLAVAFDGTNASSTQSGNTSWYWTSMLKLMEQGAAPSSSNTHPTTTTTTTTTNNNSPYIGSYFAPGHEHLGHTAVPAATSSPSSSSVHDQPLDNMLVNNNAINNNDPDSLVWSQDFLSGPICESKPSNTHHLACSDDGLHELLYPRTVLELLFSDQLKLEQLSSWPDILQQTAGGTRFGFPVAPDKISSTAPQPAGAATANIMSSETQLDIKIPAYLSNYSHLTGLDDRLSSSTASSTLSDNAIDQWVPPNVASQCENTQPPRLTAMHTSPLHGMQQIDFTHVKQEYSHGAPSPPYPNNDINANQYPKLGSPYLYQNQRLMVNAAGNLMDESMLNNEYEQKPAMINKHWINSPLIPNDPLNHRQHIYESITAANFSNNVRLGALDPAIYFQHLNKHHGGMGVPIMDRGRVSPGAAPPPTTLQYINPPSQQLGKKSRPLEATGTGQVDETQKENRRAGAAAELDTKAKGAAHMIPATTTASSPNKQQLSGPEYNVKRSRIEQSPAPPPSSSSSSIKGQPVRKEKLGERINTLQQLVSPFGKTDTASVLLEAIGYIKFLQEQVQALSSPYFKSATTQSGDEAKPDLRSRGLCLVPLSCTMQVANDNGADYWYGGTFR